MYIYICVCDVTCIYIYIYVYTNKQVVQRMAKKLFCEFLCVHILYVNRASKVWQRTCWRMWICSCTHSNTYIYWYTIY